MLVEPVKNQGRKLVPRVSHRGNKPVPFGEYIPLLVWASKNYSVSSEIPTIFLISLEKSTFYASKFLKRGEQQLCRPLVFWIIYLPDIWENRKQIIAGEKKSVDLILLSTSKI